MDSLATSPCSTLKLGTQELHHRLDRQSSMCRLMAADLTLGEYAELLVRMWRCYKPIERALDLYLRTLPTRPVWTDPAVYRRSSDIALDLQALKWRFDPASAELQQVLASVRVASLAQAAGCMYVLSGARMGARLISQSLTKHLGVSVSPALHFFDARPCALNFAEFRLEINAVLKTSHDTAVALAKAQELFGVFIDAFDH